MRRHTGSQKRAEKAKEAWGASLNSLQDVFRVFTKYTSGVLCCHIHKPAIQHMTASNTADVLHPGD